MPEAEKHRIAPPYWRSRRYQPQEVVLAYGRMFWRPLGHGGDVWRTVSNRIRIPNRGEALESGSGKEVALKQAHAQIREPWSLTDDCGKLLIRSDFW